MTTTLMKCIVLVSRKILVFSLIANLKYLSNLIRFLVICLLFVFVLLALAGSCQLSLKGQHGEFSSPGFPQGYLPDETYRYCIRVTEGTLIKIIESP